MTTIAWCGRYLAADTRRCRSGHILNGPLQKIALGGPNKLYSSFGTANWQAAWIAWDMNGAIPEEAPRYGLSENAGGFIRIAKTLVPAKKAIWVPQTCCWECPHWGDDIAPCAWGSGQEFAIGAMDAGKIAMEAVAIAIARDPNSGAPIDFIDTEFLEKGVQRWDGIMPSTRFPMPINVPLEEERLP